jgi:hypothetical protein
MNENPRTEFHVDELHTTFDTVSGDALLTDEVLARIVSAVRAGLAQDEQNRRSLAADLDLRSVVQQQRDDGMWSR